MRTIFRSCLTTSTIFTCADALLSQDCTLLSTEISSKTHCALTSLCSEPSSVRGVTGNEPSSDGALCRAVPVFIPGSGGTRGGGRACLREASHAPNRPPATNPAATPHSSAVEPCDLVKRSRSAVSCVPLSAIAADVLLPASRAVAL